jgi:acyl-CoA synthetase (AMP-forming)/AMP-acid ligase II
MDWAPIAVFSDAVRAVATAFPDKTALVGENHSLTFSAIDRRMNRLANGLAALGIQPGERVAVLSRNRPEAFEAYGASKAGLIVLPLNWRLARDELLHPLSDGEPTVILAGPEFGDLIDALRPQLPSVHFYIRFGASSAGWLSYEDLLAQASAADPKAQPNASDVLCLMYTSGTTGKPKGAMLTHGGLMRNCRAAADWMLGLKPTDVALAAMPLFHVGGMWYHLFPAFVSGCTTILAPEFSPANILMLLERNGVTYSHFVPTMISALVNHPEVNKTDLSKMRIVYYAASTMPVELLRQAMATFPHCEFMQGYGSTEGGMITALTAEDHREAVATNDHAARLSSCGRALHCEVEIRDADATGVGEVAVRSDRTMSGYWRNPAATKAVMDDGWFRTGDLGTIDQDGYLTIADRKHDMIVSGGENIYPREVEDALGQDPSILEAAVFGLPDPHWVEKVMAAVVLRPGHSATPDELRDRVRSRLTGYKCPKQIFICDDLPKSGAGKVLKRQLRKTFGAP